MFVQLDEMKEEKDKKEVVPQRGEERKKDQTRSVHAPLAPAAGGAREKIHPTSLQAASLMTNSREVGRMLCPLVILIAHPLSPVTFATPLEL